MLWTNCGNLKLLISIYKFWFITLILLITSTCIFILELKKDWSAFCVHLVNHRLFLITLSPHKSLELQTANESVICGSLRVFSSEHDAFHEQLRFSQPSSYRSHHSILKACMLVPTLGIWFGSTLNFEFYALGNQPSWEKIVIKISVLTLLSWNGVNGSLVNRKTRVNRKITKWLIRGTIGRLLWRYLTQCCLITLKISPNQE